MPARASAIPGLQRVRRPGLVRPGGGLADPQSLSGQVPIMRTLRADSWVSNLRRPLAFARRPSTTVTETAGRRRTAPGVRSNCRTIRFATAGPIPAAPVRHAMTAPAPATITPGHGSSEARSRYRRFRAHVHQLSATQRHTQIGQFWRRLVNWTKHQSSGKRRALEDLTPTDHPLFSFCRSDS